MKTSPILRCGFVFLLLSVASFALATTAASAQIVYDNGLGTTGRGDYADGGDTGADFYSSSGTVFTPTTGGLVNTVDFSGEYYVAPSVGDSFALDLYSGDPSTGPVALIQSDSFSSYTQTAVGTHTVGGTGAMNTVYQFDGSLQTTFTLTAGTTYFFSISDLSSITGSNFAVTVSDAATLPSGASNNEFSIRPSGSKSPASDYLAFQLKDEVVPEPSEWALLLLGVAALFGYRRFVRRAS